MAFSSTEAKYIEANATTKELQWLKQIFRDINYPIQDPTLFFYDNLSYIKLSKNLQFHNKSKHIELKYYFLCEKVENNEL